MTTSNPTGNRNAGIPEKVLTNSQGIYGRIRLWCGSCGPHQYLWGNSSRQPNDKKTRRDLLVDWTVENTVCALHRRYINKQPRKTSARFWSRLSAFCSEMYGTKRLASFHRSKSSRLFHGIIHERQGFPPPFDRPFRTQSSVSLPLRAQCTLGGGIGRTT